MLKGAAALLRPLRASDRAISVRWRNDPEIRDNTLGYRFPVTEESEADWIKGVLLDRSQSRLVLAIEDASDRALVGFIYLNHIDWFARNAEIGILIGDRSRQRRGLARDALALIAAYGFETLISTSCSCASLRATSRRCSSTATSGLCRKAFSASRPSPAAVFAT